MAHSLRTFGVVLGVLLGLFWAEAALAQCAQTGGLALTAAGSASGFGLSTFACGFSDNNPVNDTGAAAAGPSGSVGTGAGNVLVTDSSSTDNYSFSPTCGVGGCTVGQALSDENTSTGAVALGAVTAAGGSEYSVDTTNSLLDNFGPNGGPPYTTANESLGSINLANETYAIATLALGAGNSFPLVLGTGPNSNSPGVYVDVGGAVFQLVTDSTGGLDALASSYSSASGNATIFVGSDTSTTDAIDAYSYDVATFPNVISSPDFSVPECIGADTTGCIGGGVTGLYAIQTGDLAGELLVDTADAVDLYCVTGNSYGCSAGEVVTLATGGADGGTIGSDFNLNADPLDCGGATDVDEYTCEETVYLSQQTTLDQLLYGGGSLVNPAAGVPEPASFALFAAGLAGIACLRRKAV